MSIWMHSILKAMKDDENSSAATLRTLFYRLCKLLFFGIKPVFVFDGGVPLLKLKTIVSLLDPSLHWHFELSRKIEGQGETNLVIR